MRIRTGTTAAALWTLGASGLAAQSPSPYMQVSGTAKCFKVDLPKAMPPLGVLFDSTALVNAVQGMDWSTKGDVQVSVQYAEPASVHVMGLSAENPMAIALVNAVTTALRAAPPDAPPAFRIRIKRDKKVEVKFEKSELCEPTFESSTAVGSDRKLAFTVTQVSSGAPGSIVLGGAPRGARPPATSEVASAATTKIRINKLGYVAEVALLKSTGTIETDQAIREKIGARRYGPATLDGEPVEVWLTGDKVALVKTP